MGGINGPVYLDVPIARMKSFITFSALFWQLAREALLLCEEHFSNGQIGHRLCFIDCSRDKLRLLAYSHTLHHALKNDTECVNALGMAKDSQFIQQRGCHLIKAIRPFVS